MKAALLGPYTAFVRSEWQHNVSFWTQLIVSSVRSRCQIYSSTGVSACFQPEGTPKHSVSSLRCGQQWSRDTTASIYTTKRPRLSATRIVLARGVFWMVDLGVGTIGFFVSLPISTIPVIVQSHPCRKADKWLLHAVCAVMFRLVSTIATFHFTSIHTVWVNMSLLHMWVYIFPEYDIAEFIIYIVK